MSSTTILSDNGASSGNAGVKTSGGTDGTLTLQTTTAGGTATNALVIDNSQNVGIGTSSPTEKLHVSGEQYPNVKIETDNTTSGDSSLDLVGYRTTDSPVGYLKFWNNATSTTELARISSYREGADNTGNLRFYTSLSGSVSEEVRITSEGNVEIGNAIGLSVAPLQVGIDEPGGEALRLAWNGGSTTQGYASIGFSTTQAAAQPNAEIRGEEIDVSDYRGNLVFLTRDVNTITTPPVERMRIDYLGQLYFDSGYGSSAKAYGCRAWVNFNGTGTVAIRASGNVSSITDNGTGNYTINFTTAMPDANYSVVATSGGSTAGRAATAATNINTVPATSAQTVNGFLLNIFSGGQYDTDYGNVAIFR